MIISRMEERNNKYEESAENDTINTILKNMIQYLN